MRMTRRVSAQVLGVGGEELGTARMTEELRRTVMRK